MLDDWTDPSGSTWRGVLSSDIRINALVLGHGKEEAAEDTGLVDGGRFTHLDLLSCYPSVRTQRVLPILSRICDDINNTVYHGDEYSIAKKLNGIIRASKRSYFII